MNSYKQKNDCPECNAPLCMCDSIMHESPIPEVDSYKQKKDWEKDGKFIIIRYPDSSDCSIERFDTFEELEKAVKDNYTSAAVIACKEIEQKLVF